jgi:ABC-type multidrug transport system permease subunit
LWFSCNSLIHSASMAACFCSKVIHPSCCCPTYTKTHTQTHTQVIVDLQTVIKELLINYYRENNKVGGRLYTIWSVCVCLCVCACVCLCVLTCVYASVCVYVCCVV